MGVRRFDIKITFNVSTEQADLIGNKLSEFDSVSKYLRHLLDQEIEGIANGK